MISEGKIALSAPLDVILESHRSLDAAFLAYVGINAPSEPET